MRKCARFARRALATNVPESAPAAVPRRNQICLGGTMSSSRLLMSALFGATILAGCSAEAGPPAAMAAAAVNPITGEGLPNPNPTRIGSWATLPEGREWGSTAGLDIDPTDGHV